MASSLRGLGLGIDFNPSPPQQQQQQQQPCNPAISRLKGQTDLGKLPSSPSSSSSSSPVSNTYTPAHRRTASASQVDDHHQRHHHYHSLHNRAATDVEGREEDQDEEDIQHEDDAEAEGIADDLGRRPSNQIGRRKVRIVSAANTYHEQTVTNWPSSGESTPALADGNGNGEDGYNEQDDILDGYTDASPCTGNTEVDDGTLYEEQDSIIYPTLATTDQQQTRAIRNDKDGIEHHHQYNYHAGMAEPSPAPTMQTTLSARSTGAVSSGSSTRYLDAESMDQPQADIRSEYHHLKQKANDFEAKLRNMHISDNFPGYGAYHHDVHASQNVPSTSTSTSSSQTMHRRSFTVDQNLPVSETVATVRGNLPITSNSSNAVNRLGALKRAGAMSRPRSMMELNQLYNNQAPIDIQQLRQPIVAPQPGETMTFQQHQQQHQHQSQQLRIERHLMARTLSSQTAASASSAQYSDASPLSVFSEEGYASSAPSSIHGSGHSKPSAVFMSKQLSSIQGQAASSASDIRTSSTSTVPQLHKAQSAVSMRSMASMRGLEEAELGGGAVILDHLGKGFKQGVSLDPSHAAQLATSPNIIFGSEELVAGSLLMAQRSSSQHQPQPQPQSQPSIPGQMSRSRAASVATAKTASSSGQSHVSSLTLASLPSIQGLPSLTGAAQVLQRQSTLLSAGGNPLKRAKELDRLLDPKPGHVRSQYSPTAQPYNSTDMPSRAVFGSSADASQNGAAGSTSFHPTGAILPSNQTQLRRKPSAVMLEQSAKGKARVEMDLVLASTMVVEGGKLSGRMEVRVRKEKIGEGEVWLGAVKARIVGFEELAGEDARHVFYHHSVSIDKLAPKNENSEGATLPCYGSEPDDEGFCKGKTGAHVFPFDMQLPIGKGAKGSWKGKAGVVKYIVIGSIKLKSRVGLDRSIAHFYRHIDVYPYFNPSIILAPALKPLQSEVSKALFMGGNGKVHLKASLHRSTWVAGQRCYVNIHVKNDANKKVKTLTLSLVRTTTVFRPKPYLSAGNGYDENDPAYADVDQDACATQTTKKKVTESTLEMGRKNAKGNVTAKGTWMGVDPDQDTDFCHFLEIPSDALSIERGRYLEVAYALKVSVSGSLASEVATELPCRIVNFVSMDPPPGHPGPLPISPGPEQRPMARAWSTDHLRQAAASAGTEQPLPTRTTLGRMTSMDSLNLADLNKLYAMQHMKRQQSYDSGFTASDSSVHSGGMARSYTMPSGLGSIQEDNNAPLLNNAGQVEPGHIENRHLRHQLSLDCIGSAIASATARRAVQQRSNSNLALGFTADEYNDVPPVPQVPLSMNYGTDHREGVQLDDLDDIPDDDDDGLPYLPTHRDHGLGPPATIQSHLDGTPFSYSEHIQLHDNDYAEYEDESEDEVDLVLKAKQYESEEDTAGPITHRAPLSPSTAHLRRDNNASSPVKVARASAPPKSPSLARKAPTQGERPSSSLGVDGRASFGVASPSSPVKKGYQPVNSPPRRTTSTMPGRQTPTSPRAARPPSSTQTRKAANVAPAPPPKQQIERVPGPLSVPSVVRMQPMKGQMRKMASTPALRTQGL